MTKTAEAGGGMSDSAKTDVASLFDVLDMLLGQRNKYKESIRRWLADHDAALAAAVREQSAQAICILCEKRMEVIEANNMEKAQGILWVHINPRDPSAHHLCRAERVRALPLPNADHLLERTRQEGAQIVMDALAQFSGVKATPVPCEDNIRKLTERIRLEARLEQARHDFEIALAAVAENGSPMHAIENEIAELEAALARERKK